MVIVVVMGVCGSGKTTVGKALAQRLDCEFADADDFHPEANKDKMTRGSPLSDQDRLPWLQSIQKFIESQQKSSQTTVVACSALKRSYRDILTARETTTAMGYRETVTAQGQERVIFVFLKGSETLLRERMSEREGHFMPSELLVSQLETLEDPGVDESHVVVDIQQDVESLVEEVYNYLTYLID